VGVFSLKNYSYHVGMDILPTLNTGALIVICAPHAAAEPASILASELTLRGSLTVLDGGNRFQPYRVAHLLRERTVDVERAAKRLFIRRAFTCYQMLALLEGTPGPSQPILLLDLLAGFYDEQIHLPEAARILETCQRHIERLCQPGPMVITLAPPKLPERALLLEQVCARADRVLVQDEPVRIVSQPALFPF
jgi:hypothetical protein